MFVQFLKALISFMVVLACAVPGLAQQTPDADAASPASEDAKEEAHLHFTRGVEHYGEGNFDAALAELERAQQLAPNYKLLFNLAQVQMERHDFAAAIKLLGEYLRKGGAHIPEERVIAVADDLERLRRRVAELTVQVDVPGAEIFVNDVAVGRSPLPESVLVNVGKCHIRVTKPGYAPWTRIISVAGADRRRVILTLEPQPAQLRAQASASPGRSVSRDMTAFWVSASAALVLGGATATFGVLTVNAHQHNADVLAAYPGRASELEAARSRLQTLAGLTDGLAAATLVASVVGIYFLVSAPGRSEAAPVNRLTLRVTPTPSGAALRAAF